MKKRNNTLWVLALLGCLASYGAFSQATVNHPLNFNAGTFTVTTPPPAGNFNYYDNGGVAGNYSTNMFYLGNAVTFAPSNATNFRVRATFTSFNVEGSFDPLYIFNSNIAGTNQVQGGGVAPLQGGAPAGGFYALPGTIIANQGVAAVGANAAECLSFTHVSDGSVVGTGWAALIDQVAKINCVLTQPANVTIGASVNGCPGPVTVNAPLHNPAGCIAANALNFQYNVNGGAFTTIPYNTTVTITGLQLGVNVIIWRLVNPADGLIVSSVTQIITVADNVPPTILCPGNVTLNLGPGLCSTFYSFSVPFTDNCPLTVQKAAWAVDTAAPLLVNSSLSCSAPPNHYFQVMTQPAGAFASGFTTTFARIGVNSAYAVGSTFTVRLYTLINPALPYNVSLANRNLLAVSAPVVLPAGIGGGNINIPINAVIPPGSTVLMHVETSASYSIGNQAGAGNQTWLGSTPCGIPPDNPQQFISIGFAQEAAMVLYGQVVVPAVAVQTAGLPSGSEFPIGSTTNCFIATDIAGNTSTCCFTVTVNEYPNAIQSLICNDQVQISLDPTCQAIVNADQILEGGPYGCYDNYIVQVDKSLPFGNGPWDPAIFGPGDVGKTYQVRVTDPKTGNKCWGNILIEDKFAPVLDCPSASIPCNVNPAPLPEDICPEIVAGDKKLTQTVAFTNYWTGYMNNVQNLSGAALTIKSVKVQASLAGNAAGNYSLKAYMRNGSFVGNSGSNAGWTLCGDINANVTAGFPTVQLFDIPFTTQFSVGGGQTAGFYIVVNNGNGTGVRVVAEIGVAQTTDGTLRIVNNPGRWVNGLFGGEAFPGENPRPQIEFTYASTVKACVPLPNGLLSNQVSQNGNDWIVFAGQGSPVMDYCSDVTLSYIDTEVDGSCATGLDRTITRKWTARDASGNTSTCNQIIELFLPQTGDVALPPNYDGIDSSAISCGGVYPTPEWLDGRQVPNLKTPNPSDFFTVQGYPYVYGQPIGCSIGWTYSDARIDVCDGTYKIRRKWTVLNWCGGVFDYDQIIKIVDEDAPTFTCPANLTVSTDPFQCCATVDLPDFIVTDNCSRIKSVSAMVITFDPQTNQQTGMFNIGGNASDFPGNNYWDRDTLAVLGSTPCLPIGVHRVIYQIGDDCGNTRTCSATLTVRDFTPPVSACDEFTIVAIGTDDPFDCYGPAGFQDVPPALGSCEFAGVTWMKATTLDDGSYDNCGSIRFTVQRMSPYSDCINALNAIRGTPGCASLFPSFPSEFERAISEGDSIKFYCCEVGTTQTVILNIYQLDVNGNIVITPQGEPVRNQCMVQVEVQDKIKPVCQPPAQVVTTCESFDPSLWAYGKPTVADNCCLDTGVEYQGQCGLSHSTNISLFDTVCNRGTITRTFRVFDCHGNSSSCTQRVISTYSQNYFLRFPNDVIVTTCDGTGNYGEPTFFGEDCELLGVSFVDEIFTVVPDACFKIERTWTVINWCTYNPNLGCVEVPNPSPNAITNHPSNLPGPTIAPAGTPAPWAPTTVAVSPGAAPTNYAVFYTGGTYNGVNIPTNANNNCYKYKQIIKVIDTQKPVIASCPASPVEVCDITPNDSNFWNAMYWWDNTTQSHDLCEGPTDLSLTATDLCSKSNVTFRYLLFLDLDGDGTMETIINSTQTGLGGLGWNAVPFGNASGPGTTRQFDGRAVPANQKYGFALQTTVSGDNKTASVRWNTQQSQNTYVIPELPYGVHKIKWFVEDGCGNEQTCEYIFEVKDCKKPTVVCINGLSVNIMPTKMIVLTDADFLLHTDDNCTPSSKLVTAIRKAGQGTGFPLNPDGTPQKSVTFTCTELGKQNVEVWSQDLAGNADFCVTFVDVQDNMGNCNTTHASVSGALKTEAGNGLEDASISVVGTVPPINLSAVTDASGVFELLNVVPLNGNYSVTPTKDNDPLNGVSTFDLVLINKHILGLEPLSSPYKMISADANNSRSITTFDIVELRKLILGIYTELPNNTSWRFVDKGFAFPNQTNPFQTIFPETKQIANMSASQMAEDFFAMKVGDVNGNAVTSSLLSTEDRTAGTLLFDVQDRTVKAGETFTVTFKASEKVQGYQFTLNHAGLELVDVKPGANMSLANFGVFADDKAVTTSWDGDVQAEFAMTFRATAAGELSRMLGVSGRITKAEAYNGGAERLQVGFRFNGANGQTITGLGFELYQNTPNPFVNKTQIGFHLPEATTATLTIFDETGRMLFTQKGDFAKGYNAVTVDRSVLNATGVLYYTLETAKESATRKMIQTK